jgi:hypothetical protein
LGEKVESDEEVLKGVLDQIGAVVFERFETIGCNGKTYYDD